MIRFNIQSSPVSAYSFVKGGGVTVSAEMDTMVRWKKVLDAWSKVQSEMEQSAKAFTAPPQETIQFGGVQGETVVFDSRAYNGSGVANGIEPPKPTPIQTITVPPRVKRKYTRKVHRAKPRQAISVQLPPESSQPDPGIRRQENGHGQETQNIPTFITHETPQT